MYVEVLAPLCRPGDAASCLYTADQHVSWNLSSTSAATTGARTPPKLSYIRWVYNASEFAAAISDWFAHDARRTDEPQWRRRFHESGGQCDEQPNGRTKESARRGGERERAA